MAGPPMRIAATAWLCAMSGGGGALAFQPPTAIHPTLLGRAHARTSCIGRRGGAPTTPFVPDGGLTACSSVSLLAKKTSAAAAPAAKAAALSDSTRAKRTAALADWAESSGIKIGGIEVSGGDGVAGGLGLVANRNLNPSDVVVQVPTDIILSVQSPGEYNRAARELFEDKDCYRDAPWWAQLSVQLNRLDKVNAVDDGSGVNMQAWLDSLPRRFDTPIHWPEVDLDGLQYDYLSGSVSAQKRTWESEYRTLIKGAGSGSPLKAMSFDDFVWGAECARSRAFSGTYGGSAFNPLPYALTLLLVAAYVGLNLGTIDQAANGAALVVCGSILKDFVLPKLSKVKKYIICPYIDMANHKGIGERGDVAFEYFADTYSLSVKDGPVSKGRELFISYGPRSNDQLLQYYGFVEPDNPHDVYIMPPLRDWDIAALEEACGRKFSAGRLAKLDRAGLLGFDGSNSATDGDDGAANRSGGVVVTRSGGFDPAVLQALRALVSTDAEWEASGEAIGNFAAESSGGKDNERFARLAARTALELELASKRTTVEEDKQLLKTMESSKSLASSTEEKLAVLFRIEKKKLLKESIDKL